MFFLVNWRRQKIFKNDKKALHQNPRVKTNLFSFIDLFMVFFHPSYYQFFLYLDEFLLLELLYD